MKIGVFTIASKNYLAYVRTLLNSVSRFHPEYSVYLCLADQVDGYFDVKNEMYRVVPAGRFEIPDFKDMTIRYSILELNTAVKPFMFKWLFDNTDLDAVIYLDPDIRLYSRFETLESVLHSDVSIVLTPHITVPLEDGKNPNDYHMLQSGVFNLGFMAANRCPETLHYMDWWSRRLRTQCVSDISHSLFTDQKWCDLAPCFLDKLKVFKDPGYNVAYWNLSERDTRKHSENEWEVNGRPLIFFHFSGINVEKKKMVSKHQNRFGWGDIYPLQSLFENYLKELIKYGWEETSKWPYAYGFVGDKEKLLISPLIRHLYRLTYPDPISIDEEEAKHVLIDLCNQDAEGIMNQGDLRITRLMALIYKLRPDLQEAFNLNTADGQHQFVNWFQEAGARENSLSSVVVNHGLKEEKGHKGSSIIKKAGKLCYRTLMFLKEPVKDWATRMPLSWHSQGKIVWGKVITKIMKTF